MGATDDKINELRRAADRVRREAERIDSERRAVEEATRRLDSRPMIEGRAVDTIRLEQRREIRERVAALELAEKARDAEIGRIEQDMKAFEDRPPGVIGWVVRLPWPIGLMFGLLVPLLTVVPVTLFSDAGRAVGKDFYSAAAQVLPILVLAVVVEGRMFAWIPWSAAVRASYLGLLVWVATGEAATLIALGRGNGSTLLFALTVVGLLYGACILAYVGLARPAS